MPPTFSPAPTLQTPFWVEAMPLIFEVVKLCFVFAFGACVGSLTNVLVYRIPRGLDFVTPSSRCTSCDTKLTWRENFPILGWLWLRGKCKFCRSPISPEYILVETFVALLWACTFLVLYMGSANPFGLDWSAVQPEWAQSGFGATWPLFVLLVLLFSLLVAMTLVDAKTFTIPPVLTNVPTALGLIAHVGFALYLTFTHRTLAPTAPGWSWAIATPGPFGWGWIGAAIGGVLGLLIANALLATGLLKRSFEGYAAWEEEQLKLADEQAKQSVTQSTPPASQDNPAPTSELPDMHPHLWVQYPHARREVLREVLFLAAPLALAYLGSMLAHKLAGPWTYSPEIMLSLPAKAAPLWLSVLAGVFLGYLIGGGAVWLIRIVGTLGFGKEALGLGDVHMMAAVGACLGWVDPVLAFFGAAFLGVAWYVVGKLHNGAASKVMPFGPFLAMGTVLVFFAKPLCEKLLSSILHAPINLP